MRQQYETGQGSQASLVQLQLTIEQLEEQLRDRQSEEEVLLDELMAMTGRLDIVTPQTVSAAELPQSEQDIDRPAIRAVDHEIEAETVRHQLHRRELLPAPTVWAGVRIRNHVGHTDTGAELVSAGLSLPIPVAKGASSRQHRAVSQAKVSELSAHQEDLRRRFAAERAVALERWTQANRQLETVEQTLLPSAQQVVMALQSEVAVDRAAVSELLQAELTVLTLERKRIQALIASQQSRTQWLAALGRLGQETQ